MVEPIHGMPAGTCGFRLGARLTGEDYFEIVEAIQAQVERTESISFLVEIREDFYGVEFDAPWEEVKRAASLALIHRSRWKRIALVTDKESVSDAVTKFGWLVPGHIAIYDPADLEQAKDWVGGGARFDAFE